MHESSDRSIAGVVLLVLLMAGCATGPTRLQSTYGISYHAARASQFLHPEAAVQRTPVEALDGKAAQHVLDRYRTTFEQPPPPPSFAISIGQIK